MLGGFDGEAGSPRPAFGTLLMVEVILRKRIARVGQSVKPLKLNAAGQVTDLVGQRFNKFGSTNDSLC